jgi:ribosomal protein S5
VDRHLAAFEALKSLRSPRMVASARGKRVGEILGRGPATGAAAAQE